MPILATTATANDRVLDDVSAQLGIIEVLRGPLIRESLVLQNIKMNSQAERIAWLKEILPGLTGCGIIYTLTRRDDKLVAEYLIKAGIPVAPYYSGSDEEEATESSYPARAALEAQLYNNEIKALVATSALGMGYNKPDSKGCFAGVFMEREIK